MAEMFRDIQCSMDVAQMVELGKFDKEFTVYGCAYRYNGETYFRISEHEETIYRFCEKNNLQGVCTTNVMRYHYVTDVPAGTKDDIWEEVKWNLGYELLKVYPDDFLDLLNQLQARPSKNGAWPYLKQWQENLDGHFQRNWLDLFDCVTIECVLVKQLDLEHYQQLKQWSDNNWMQMEDDTIQKDIHERTLHGFAYLKNSTKQYKMNAQYVKVYQERQNLRNKGMLVTPIYSQTYWFKTQTQFPKLKKQYQEQLEKMLEPCIQLVEKLDDMPSFLTPEEYSTLYQNVCSIYGQSAVDTFYTYGRRWNCIKAEG